MIVIDDYDATSEALSGHLDTLRQLRDHVRLHSDFGFYVWAAGKEKQVLCAMELKSPISATVTAANGVLYVATMQNLYAIAPQPAL